LQNSPGSDFLNNPYIFSWYWHTFHTEHTYQVYISSKYSYFTRQIC